MCVNERGVQEREVATVYEKWPPAGRRGTPQPGGGGSGENVCVKKPMCFSHRVQITDYLTLWRFLLGIYP